MQTAHCALKVDVQNSVISFDISKWMLPELSFFDRWSRGTKLWERDCLKTTLKTRRLQFSRMPSSFLRPLISSRYACALCLYALCLIAFGLCISCVMSTCVMCTCVMPFTPIYTFRISTICMISETGFCPSASVGCIHDLEHRISSLLFRFRLMRVQFG